MFGVCTESQGRRSKGELSVGAFAIDSQHQNLLGKMVSVAQCSVPGSTYHPLTV